jgi:isopentenyldiphosphate isomerase
VLLQKRSATKDTFPNRWAHAASGHVDRGEDYDTAMVREPR